MTGTTIGTPGKTTRPAAEVAAMPVHPAAALFPTLNGVELAALTDDIAEHGVCVRVSSGTASCLMVDGRWSQPGSRQPTSPRSPRCPSSSSTVTPTPYTAVVSSNLARRHLSSGQGAFIALRLKPIFAADG